MVRIRLRRVGKKKQPSYRIVVIKSEAPATGRPIENLGHFNPRTEPETVVINEERALYWLSVGAQPSEAVLRLLKNLGIVDRLALMKSGESFDTAKEESTEPGKAEPPSAGKEEAAVEEEE